MARVAGVAAGCDTAREGAGLLAAVVMGWQGERAWLRCRNWAAVFETLAQLIIGVLFVSISLPAAGAVLAGRLHLKEGMPRGRLVAMVGS